MKRSIHQFGTALVTGLFVAACASTPSNAPKVTIAQRAAPPDFEIRAESGVPVEFRLTIDNPREEPVTLVALELETVGSSGGYQLNRVRHAFSQVIPAKSSDTVDFRAWVQPLSRDQRGDISSPVLLRGTARFQTAAGAVSANFSGRGQ